MIRRVVLIARQEFLKYVMRRGFLISTLMVPLFIAFAAVVPSLVASQSHTRILTVVDRAGGYEQALAEAAARDEAHVTLTALADYAAKHADWRVLERRDPALAAMLEAPDRVAQIKDFQNYGARKAVATLSHALRPGAPAFMQPRPHFVLVPAPRDLAAANDTEVRTLARAYLTGKRQAVSQGGAAKLFAIVVIPKEFSPGAPVAAQYWTTDPTNTEAVNFVHWALTDAFRVRLLQQLVPSSHKSDVNLDVDADIQTFDPTKSAGPSVSLADRLAPLVPMGLAVLLFIVAFSNAALLLQSVIEEKSTRMIEVLLSCASPPEIMTGKLLGVIAVALVTLLLWGLGLFAVASFLSHETMTVVAAGLAAIASLQLLPLILLYFLCGLVIYSSIFLGIGAMTNSLPDAQALMTPATLVIILPMTLLSVVVRDPNGLFASILSWIPIYTPFFMLIRLPFHPPAIELWLTSVLVVLTTAFLVHRMGRVFANNVLTTERPPAFGVFLKQLFGRKPA